MLSFLTHIDVGLLSSARLCLSLMPLELSVPQRDRHHLKLSVTHRLTRLNHSFHRLWLMAAVIFDALFQPIDFMTPSSVAVEHTQ